MNNLVNILEKHSVSKQHDIAFTFINDLGDRESISYSELYRQSSTIAHYLRNNFVKGDRVVILLPQGIEYIYTFIACLQANVVAVPLYPPKLNQHADRVDNVVSDCTPELIITSEELVSPLKEKYSEALVVDKKLLLKNIDFNSVNKKSNQTEENELAFLQYTSGSTGQPKGVMVSHGNIIANLDALKKATQGNHSEVFCNWLPLFHDLGLILTMLLPIFLGAHSVLMSPFHFIRRPLVWLEAISHYKATICGAPNFAFDYCVEKIKDEKIVGLDLSHWRMAYNAAEPVKYNTLKRFAEKFAEQGFRENAICPCYGMAEATVFISSSARLKGYVAQQFDSEMLGKGQAKVSEDAALSKFLISSGRTQFPHEIKILDLEENIELSDGAIGEICYAGPSVALGYWGNENRTLGCFSNFISGSSTPFLRTEDLGFKIDGELFVTGRIKDLMIINGRNLYPQDFENTASEYFDYIRTNGAAAFEEDGKCYIVFEVEKRKQNTLDYEAETNKVSELIFKTYDVFLEDVVFIRAGTLSKTSSGKVKRAKVKSDYFSEELGFISSLKAIKASKPAEFTLPDSEIEVMLSDIWKQELGIDNIDVNQSFFMLGGESKSAVKVISDIEEKLSVRIDIADVLAYPSIRQLSGFIKQLVPSSLPELTSQLFRSGLSSTQNSLFFAEQRSEFPLYNLSFGFRLDGKLNRKALEKAFDDIIERHPALRTRIIRDEETISQEINENAEHAIQYLDAKGRDTEEILTHEALTPFNFPDDLMIRVVIINASDDSHVLIVTTHHLVTDGWSSRIIINELANIYNHSVSGVGLKLSTNTYNHLDFANWQNELIRGEFLESQIAYWLNKLKDTPEVHRLPLDYQRSEKASFQCESVEYDISKALQEKLTEVAIQQGTSLFTTFCAALTILLNKFTGENDVTFGFPVSNRDMPEFQSIVGCFVNTLVFRANIDRDISIVDVINMSRGDILSSMKNQQVPFDYVVKKSLKTRPLNYNPLIQILIVQDNSASELLPMEGINTQPLNMPIFSEFDLTLRVFDDESGCSIAWQYNKQLFKRSTVVRFAEYFDLILNIMVKQPESKISELNLLAASDAVILQEQSETGIYVDDKQCIQDLFSEQAVNHPNSTALVFREEKVTYAELESRANKLASYLCEHYALVADNVIGICMERSVDMIVSIMAILKTGCAYTPIDPDYPISRIQFIVKDSSPVVILTRQRFESQLYLFSEKTVCLDNEVTASKINQYSSIYFDNSSITISQSNLAYIIYTSGSTGQPKGVMVEHKALRNRLDWMQFVYQMNHNDNVLQKTPFSFDVSVWEFLWTLGYGGTLVIAEPEKHKDPYYIRDIIHQQNITILHFVPSMLHAMFESNAWENFNSIRYVFCSGEALPKPLVQEFKQATPNLSLVNLYGPTEAAIDVSYFSCDSDIAHNTVPIGKPIQNTELFVLDESCNMLPIGVIGELYISGAGLARGYLNRTELTVKKFVLNPYFKTDSASSSELMYRTGDLARWLPDGNLEYIGRNDDQVKIRGFRVELGEVESILLDQEGIEQAVVIAHNSGNINLLVGYYKASHKELDADLLKAKLQQILPAYMVPALLLPVDCIPLTTNGKVDRKALPPPDFTKAQVRYAEPSTDTEKGLADIWQDILGIEVIGKHDNFFALGGHSLQVAKMITAAHQKHLVLDVEKIYSSATLSELAQKVDQKGTNLKVPLIMPSYHIPENSRNITPEMLPLVDLCQDDIEMIASQLPGGVSNIKDIYPLGALQEGIFFHHLLAHDVDPYITNITLKVKSEVALNNLIDGFKYLVSRHDILRTAVISDNLPSPVQVVYREAELLIEHLSVDSKVSEEVYVEKINNACPTSMDITKAPCVRFNIGRIDNEGVYYVVMQLHHIIDDASSLVICFDEISSFLKGEHHSLPPVEPYRNFIANSIHHNKYSDSEAYFESSLKGVIEPTLPFNLSELHSDGKDFVCVNHSVSTEISQRIREVSKQLKLSPAAFFHAVWSLVISVSSGRDDIVFGSVLSGRAHGVGGVDSMLGLMVNTLPLRVDISQKTSSELLLQIQNTLRELLSHEQTPLSLAQKASSVNPGTPLFSGVINYRHPVQVSSASKALNAISGIEIINYHESANYPFDLQVDDFGESSSFGLDLRVHNTISANIVMEYIQTALKSLLESLEKQPSTLVKGLEVMPRTEKIKLLEEWNSTVEAYPSEAFHICFSAQARHSPDAVAVESDGTPYSYAQLECKANQLAIYLQQSGVKSGDVVGICSDPSVHLCAGLLAIMKLGACFVLLDSQYPETRLNYMIQDSEMVGLLTTTACEHVVKDYKIPCYIIDQIPYESVDKETFSFGHVTLDQTSSLFYTSGSTGKPKGTLFSHAGLVNYANSMCELLSCLPESRFLQMSSIGFDVILEELLPCWMGGGTVVLGGRKGCQDISILSDTISEGKITCFEVSFGHWREWLNWMQANEVMPPICLKSVIVGCDSIPNALMEQWQKYNIPLIHVYGLTETTVTTTVWNSHGSDVSQYRNMPMGKPIGNTQVYVLDDSFGTVPVGVSGEMYVGGLGVTKGYQNKPEMTAERFVRNPFYDKENSSHSEYLYKTGDIVRWLEDGNLLFVGRNDEQVKVRGFRVELGEVESALQGIEGIDEALVSIIESGNAQKQVIGYYHSMTVINSETVREQLKQVLPDYMVPTFLIELESFPLTSNGKINRKLLPKPEVKLLQGEYIQPETELEKVLAKVWSEILDIDISELSTTANFFTLGGHSLMVMKLISRLQKLDINISAQFVFSTSSLAELAKLIDESKKEVSPGYLAPPNLIPSHTNEILPEMLPLVELSSESIESIVSKVPGGVSNIQDIYPLGPLQSGILFHYMLNHDVDPYITSFSFRIKGKKSMEKLLAGLQYLVARHDVMRTAIFWEGLPTAVQVVLKQANLVVRRVTLENCADEMDCLERMKAYEINQMDITKAPLWLATVGVLPDSEQHYLLLQEHHLVNDHIGLDIMQHELTMFMNDRQEELLIPPQYREFIAHTQYQAEHNNAEKFFSGLLGTVEEGTFPFGLSDVQGDASEVIVSIEMIPKELSRRIRAASSSMNVGPAAFFHTVWAMVIAACSSREDVVFGTVVSGRLQGIAGADQMMGAFVNTLPIRISLSEMTVGDVVLDVQRLLNQLLPYEQTSLSLAQSCSGVYAGTPLFSSMLNYRHSNFHQPNLTPEVLADVEAIRGEERTNYPFTLSVDDLGTESGFSLEVQVIESIGAKRILDYVNTAVESLVNALESGLTVKVTSLPIITNDERLLQLVEWNETNVDYPQDKCIHQLFEQQVNATPDAIALVIEDAKLTYSELNSEANKLAHYLVTERGITPDTLVGICLDRSTEMVISILGVLKAGGAYVPLDPDYPQERLVYMLNDACLGTVLTHTSLQGKVPFTEHQVVYLDSYSMLEQLKNCLANNVNVRDLTSSNLAYVIYTSGSTGKPKGVMVEHRSQVNYLTTTPINTAAARSDSLLAVTSISFDIHTLELFLPLIQGATLVVATKPQTQSGKALCQLIENNDISVMQATPSTWHMLLSEQWEPKSSFRALCGGEALTEALKNKLLSINKLQLWNMYGPTETCVWSFTAKMKALDAVCIGRPISNTQCYVFSELGRLSPVGTPGELHIGGAGLARGYLNQSGLTEQKFIINPFFEEKNSSQCGERLYKTGDLVRYLPDGSLEFLGRIDHQVKVRGFRIELGEIEHQLLSHNDVEEAVVIAVSNEDGDKLLVAYVTPSNASTMSIDRSSVKEDDHTLRNDFIESLKGGLGQSLPGYMIPNAFAVLEHLPLTPNGKIDRLALSTMDTAWQQQEYIAPRTETERMLCEICQDVLSLEQIGIEDNFFMLGGHSLLVMTLIARLQLIGHNIPAQTIFEATTLGDLAEAIDKKAMEEYNDDAKYQEGLKLVTSRHSKQTEEIVI